MKNGIILPADISAAIVERLKAAFPGEAVYTDLAPRDFQRPSNMVELAKLSLDPLGYGQSGVPLLCQFKITTFSAVDAVHASHLPILDLRAMLVIAAFAGGYIRVKDRAPKVRSVKADTSFFDCAEVLLDLELALDRADFVAQEFYEMMRDFQLKIQAEE